MNRKHFVPKTCQMKWWILGIVVSAFWTSSSYPGMDDSQDNPRAQQSGDDELFAFVMDAAGRFHLSPNPASICAFPLWYDKVLESSQFILLSGTDLNKDAVVKVANTAGDPDLGELYYSNDRKSLYYSVDKKVYAIAVVSPDVDLDFAWLGKIDRDGNRAAFTVDMKTAKRFGKADRSCLLCVVDLAKKKVECAIFSDKSPEF